MNNYCLFICSDQIRMNESTDTFIDVVNDFGQSVGLKLTHISATIKVDETETDITTSESLFSVDAANTLKNDVKTKLLSGLSIWSAQYDLEENYYLNLLAEMVDAGPSYNYKFVTISFPMELIEGMTINDIFSRTSKLLKSLNRLGKIDYALLTTMNSSLVQTYFRGIFTSELSDEEALDIAMWENKHGDRKNLLRGIFWGNLLAASHLRKIPDRDNFIERLSRLVDGLYTTISGDDLFFMLPTITMKSDPSAISVKTLLKEYDLIMEPDDDDYEIVSRLVSR